MTIGTSSDSFMDTACPGRVRSATGGELVRSARSEQGDQVVSLGQNEVLEAEFRFQLLVELHIPADLIEKARGRYERERQPAVVQAAERYFFEMTLGRYRRIIAPLGESSLHVVEANGQEKTPDQLSRGTREQLYLALRFGLIEQFRERSGPLPIVVDEVLVNFDRERALAAARGFARLAQRHQVIAFTCHEWVVDLFREADGATRVWMLDGAVQGGPKGKETEPVPGRYHAGHALR